MNRCLDASSLEVVLGAQSLYSLQGGKSRLQNSKTLKII